MKKLIKHALAHAFCGPLFHFIPSSKVESISTDRAMQIVAKHSPNLGQSSLCNYVWIDPIYDLTIIVPIYNAEKYLKTCLDSILNQKTEYNFHIVVVNDGSTDSSANILKKYSNDDRILVIDQPNGGAAKARNTALSKVCGRYILFVDADDFLPENAVEVLLRYAYEIGADIVQGNYALVNEAGDVYAYSQRHKKRDNVPPNGVLEGYVCGKVYKANLFRKIQFPQGYWYEDTIITALITHLAEKIATISDVGYFYRQNPTSMTSFGKGKSKSVDAYWVQQSVMHDRHMLGLVTDCAYYEHLLRMVALCYKRTVSEPEEVKKSLMVLWKDLLIQEHKTDFVLASRYKKFEKAIFECDYGRYKILCKFLY